MLIDQKGSENGTVLKQFNQDQIYVTTDWLADVFTQEKWAVEMDTPESLEKERKEAIGKLGTELSNMVVSCFEAGLDSIQLMDRIEKLKKYPVLESDFQEKFKEAQKIKSKSIEDAESSLSALNRANAAMSAKKINLVNPVKPKKGKK